MTRYKLSLAAAALVICSMIVAANAARVLKQEPRMVAMMPKGNRPLILQKAGGANVGIKGPLAII